MIGKKLKIAFCYSGFVRNFRHNYLTNKNIINFLNPDIFIYAYDTFGYKNKSLIPEPKTDALVDLSYFDEIKNIKKIKIDNFNENDIIDLEDKNMQYYMHNHHAYPKNILSQLNGIYSCNELKKEHENKFNFKYDVVFRIRFDSLFLQPNILDISKTLARVSKDNIFVSNGYGWGSHCNFCEKEINHKNHSNDVSDIFAFGDSNTMDYYSSLFLVANEIHKNTNIYNERCVKNMKNIKLHENKTIFDINDLTKNDYLNKDIFSNDLYLFYPESLLRLYLFDKKILKSNIKIVLNRNELY